jgi:hypothetical protein
MKFRPNLHWNHRARGTIIEKCNVNSVSIVDASARYHDSISSSVACMALFRCFKVPKILQDSVSYRIFGRMYGALNIGKKITNYTVWL